MREVDAMTVESINVPAITACFAVPATALWLHHTGPLRILARCVAAGWALHEAAIAARARYREVYAQTVAGMEGRR